MNSNNIFKKYLGELLFLYLTDSCLSTVYLVNLERLGQQDVYAIKAAWWTDGQINEKQQ